MGKKIIKDLYIEGGIDYIQLKEEGVHLPDWVAVNTSTLLLNFGVAVKCDTEEQLNAVKDAYFSWCYLDSKGTEKYDIIRKSEIVTQDGIQYVLFKATNPRWEEGFIDIMFVSPTTVADSVLFCYTFSGETVKFQKDVFKNCDLEIQGDLDYLVTDVKYDYLNGDITAPYAPLTADCINNLMNTATYRGGVAVLSTNTLTHLNSLTPLLDHNYRILDCYGQFRGGILHSVEVADVLKDTISYIPNSIVPVKIGNNCTVFGQEVEKDTIIDFQIDNDIIYDTNYDYGCIVDNERQSFKDDYNNYDYSKVSMPANILNSKIENYSEGNDNKIRLSNNTIKSCIDGFQSKNLAYSGYYSVEVNGISVTYNNGTLIAKGTNTSGISYKDASWKYYIYLTKGRYSFRKYIEESTQITLVLVDKDNETNQVSVKNGRAFVDILTEGYYYIGLYISATGVEVNETSGVELIKEEDYKDSFAPPLAKLDYIVEQANAKGYSLVRDAWRETRNLYRVDDYSNTMLGMTVTYSNGLFTCKGTRTTAGGRLDSYYPTFTLKAGTYTLSHTGFKNCGVNVCLSNAVTKGAIVTLNWNSTPKPLTFTEDTDVIIGINFIAEETVDISFYFQLEKGDTATSFVPPIENIEAEITPSLYFDGKTRIDTKVFATNKSICSIEGYSIGNTTRFFGNTGTVNSNAFSIVSGTTNDVTFYLANNSYGFSVNVSNRNKYTINALDGKLYINDINRFKINYINDFITPVSVNIGCRWLNDSYSYLTGIIYYYILNDNIYVPSTNGMINITTNEFLPLLDLDDNPIETASISTLSLDDEPINTNNEDAEENN